MAQLPRVSKRRRSGPYKKIGGLRFGRHNTMLIGRNLTSLAPGGALGRAVGPISRTQEVKCLDIPKSVSLYTAAGTVQALNLIQVGSSFFNRIGRRIRMKSIQIFGELHPLGNLTGVVPPETLRTVIVYDRQTNGAYPALTDIFQDTDQFGGNTTNEISGINLNNRERFAIILDIKHKAPTMHVTSGIPDSTLPIWPTDGALHSDSDGSFYLDHFRKLKGAEVHYKSDSNPAVIGDIATGGLYIVTFGASGNWATSIKTRLRYNDD